MIDQLKLFGDSLGWMSNLIGLLPLFAIYKYWGRMKIYILGCEFNNVKDYVDKVNSLSIRPSNRVIKIAIVDDEPHDFPVEYLKRCNYDVIVFEEISLSEYEKFSSYDIVFLDMIGVVIEDRDKGALELIKRIKGMNNSPYVVAVSKTTFDPTVTEYFKLANDVAKKPIDSIKCDDLIKSYKNEVSSEVNSKKVDEILNQRSVPTKMANKVTSIIVGYLEGKMSDEVFLRRINCIPANFEKDSLIFFVGKIKDDLS
ncbi:response regulator [Iodobacter sp. CM08]|uniref:response regulator n=1 Tax=Iodobacter sp. CM08 TaxID=3085902 RepID=UPI002980E033|nr:response regulator [Iodobacter sp. CM08]MDW5416727.1 response regulator [Iodobacter sp. CM08]